MIVEDTKCCTCGKESLNLNLIPTWDFRILFDEKEVTGKTLACNRCYIECQMVAEVYSKEDINNEGKKPKYCFVCNRESLYLFNVRQNNKSAESFITKIQYCHGLVINNSVVNVCHRCLYLMDMWYNLKQRYQQLNDKSRKRKHTESMNTSFDQNKRRRPEESPSEKLAKIQKLLQLDIKNADSFHKSSRLKSRRSLNSSTIDLTGDNEEHLNTLKPASSVLNSRRVSRRIRTDQKLFSKICYVDLSNSGIDRTPKTTRTRSRGTRATKPPPTSPAKRNTKTPNTVQNTTVKTSARIGTRSTAKNSNKSQKSKTVPPKTSAKKSTKRNPPKRNTFLSRSNRSRKKSKMQLFPDFEENSNFQIETADEVITLDDFPVNSRRNSDAVSDKTEFDVTEAESSSQKVVMVLLHNVDDINKRNHTPTTVQGQEPDPLSEDHAENLETASDKTEFDLPTTIASKNLQNDDSPAKIDTFQKDKTNDLSDDEPVENNRDDDGNVADVEESDNETVEDNSRDKVLENDEDTAAAEPKSPSLNNEISEKNASENEVAESTENLNTSTGVTNSATVNDTIDAADKTENSNDVSNSKIDDANESDSSVDNNVIVVVHDDINSTERESASRETDSHSDKCHTNNDTTNPTDPTDIEIISESVEVVTTSENENFVSENSNVAEDQNSVILKNNVHNINDKNIDDKYTKVAQKLAELDA